MRKSFAVILFLSAILGAPLASATWGHHGGGYGGHSTRRGSSYHSGGHYGSGHHSSGYHRGGHHGSYPRSSAAREKFMRMTGYPHGRPGYVIDHIVPLSRGGTDDPNNMQWQTIEEAKAKDRWERK